MIAATVAAAYFMSFWDEIADKRASTLAFHYESR